MRSKIVNLMGIVALMLVGVGCGNEPSSNNGSSNNAVDPDAGSNANMGDSGNSGNATDPDARNNGTDADICAPITECAVGQCGEVDDGCGGTIQCAEVCGCEDGIPQVANCGPCGLGVLSCGANETGTGSCELPPIPEIGQFEEACEDRVIYVNTTADAGGDGTKDRPFQNYIDASVEANAGDAIVLAAPQGAPLEQGTIQVLDGVHVVGGYNTNFQFDPEARSFVRVSGSSGEDTFGIAASAINEPTLLYGMDILTSDNEGGTGVGTSNYAVWVEESDGLDIVNVNALAGAGMSGESGAAGQNGADGPNGGDAPRAPGLGSGETPRATNPECPNGYGGFGGRGSWRPGAARGRDGERGGGGALGGRRGDSVNPIGLKGEDGAPVQSATNGSGGLAGGRVAAGLYLPEGAGESGLAGEDGNGGGGGGGAFYEEVGSEVWVGTAGGAGGAGGCGGEGGEGGQPGGASFGLFATNSNLSIINASFRAGRGGDGGDGGDAGAGGIGGRGGEGTSLSTVYNVSNTGRDVTLPHFSGDGGQGSAGGDGGKGGGGAGGASYGVFCEQSRIDIAADEVSNTFISGAGGAGGRSSGNPGERGLSEDVEGCNL